MSHEDNRTLQDKIAERLFNIDGKRQQSGDLRPWGSTGNELQHRYLRLASEVVRFMEWSISEQVKASHGGTASINDQGVKPTLPPNDWLP